MADDRAKSRARNPLPEEQTAGVDDAEAQAEAVLDESDERQFLREPDEERTSEDVTDPI